MRRPLALALLLLTALASAAVARQRRTLTESFDVTSEQRIRLDLPVADLTVRGGRGSKVIVELELTCRDSGARCEETLAEVRLDARSSRRSVSLELEGLPRWRRDRVEVEGTITIPAGNAVDLDLGVGEVEIYGLTGDVNVDLGIGEVELEMARRHIGSLELDTGIGEAELEGAPDLTEVKQRSFLGGEVSWGRGPGDARIGIDVGIGSVTVRLDG